MASAKPGIQPNKITITKQAPPTAPDWLSPTQHAAWDELTSNLLVSAHDVGLLYAFMRTLALHEEAHQSLSETGLLVTGYRNELKPNPAYRVFKETTQTLLTLRTALMATPAARLKVAQSTVVEDDDTANTLELD